MKLTLVAATALSVTLLSSAALATDQSAADILKHNCQQCHDMKLGGAPALDDKDAWAPRIATGIDAMVQTVISGKGAMPPRGTCMSCTDEQLKEVVELMVEPLQ